MPASAPATAGVRPSSGGRERTELRSHPSLISRVPYLPGLDGMRALAVVAVMIYHANSDWLPGGFLGVEMFFVISGYLITLLLIAERERDYTISLKKFWIRRARRLLPALFTLMTLLTIWTALFERNALGQLRGDVIGGFFYVSNWYQVWVGLGYTAAGDFAPLRHLWSLAVEEQFYLIWPIVMVVVLHRSGTRHIAVMSRWLFLAAIVVSIVVALLFHPGPVQDPSLTPEAYWWLGDRPISKIDTLYLSTVGRAGGLLLGAAMAMLWRPFAIIRGPLRTRGALFDVVALLALAGFAWMCWNIYLVGPTGADPRLFRFGLFAAGILTLLIIAAVTHPGARANRIVGNRALVWIGVRSYGLYLYHWPIYQIIRNVAGNKLTLSEFVFAMFLTVIVTELSFRFIETPIRTGRFMAMVRSVRRQPAGAPKRLFVGGVALTTALAVFAGVALATAPLKQNDIAVSLDSGEEFTIDLANAAAGPALVERAEVDEPAEVPTTQRPATTAVRASSVPATSVPDAGTPSTAPLFERTPSSDPPRPSGTSVPSATAPAGSTQPTTTTRATTPANPGAAPGTDQPVVVPASTVPPSTAAPTTVPATQRGVVTDIAAIEPLTIPEVAGGLPLVALGDSVMLGAAEELSAVGFTVDAVKSRQMISFLPDMALIREAGAFGPVVVVHLGTNGPFSDDTLSSMMNLLVDVPIVVVLTGRGPVGWLADNNAKLRELPNRFDNVTVLDWERIADSCDGRCFYDDGIHLTQSGQNHYALAVNRLLGLA